MLLAAAALPGLPQWLSRSVLPAAHAEAAVQPAPPLLLAQTYGGQVAVADYWVSEKYDGVRAYWDGKQLYFRSGRRIAAPRWFVRALPAVPLDGELWLGRGRFQELVGVVRRDAPVDAEWRQVRYMLFELPGAAGTFSQRLLQLQALTQRLDLAWLQTAPQLRVRDERELLSRLDSVVAAGGEGLMLHHAAAPYVSGRSAYLLKLTPERDDEAVVLEHLPGKGRFTGMMGALRVRNSAGTEFRIGTGFSDAERRQPPPLGSVITYRYRELTQAGLPRFPRYLRPHTAL